MLPDHLEAKIDRSGECHLWTGYLDRYGYGQTSFKGKLWYIHRLAYTLGVGAIPADMTIDHVVARGCVSRACVNIAHLEVVTRGENVLRGTGLAAQNVRKTHCPQGHPYDDKNTHIRREGWRACRTCHREAARRHREKKRHV